MIARANVRDRRVATTDIRHYVNRVSLKLRTLAGPRDAKLKRRGAPLIGAAPIRYRASPSIRTFAMTLAPVFVDDRESLLLNEPLMCFAVGLKIESTGRKG